MTTPNFTAILTAAHEAATDAVAGLPDGRPCGFAWVTIPGTSALALHCRAALKDLGRYGYTAHSFYGDTGYPKVWQFWQPGRFRGQSIHAHEVGAVAFQRALQAHGIEAQAGSRLD